MDKAEKVVRECAQRSGSRLGLWTLFLNAVRVKKMVELGVYRGDFAAKVLKECGTIKRYYMIDPWRHLDGWNKPANESGKVFDGFFRETKKKTDFAARKRVLLRGTTTEVVSRISDGELDFAYIDGDHTLRGIAIDLINLYPKVRMGGWIGGDDFERSVWQHSARFEPTLVFPFAVHFAEAVGARIYGLPHGQFLLEKRAGSSFAFVDLTGRYPDTGLLAQVRISRMLVERARRILSAPMRAVRSIRRMVGREAG